MDGLFNDILGTRHVIFVLPNFLCNVSTLELSLFAGRGGEGGARRYEMRFCCRSPIEHKLANPFFK